MRIGFDGRYAENDLVGVGKYIRSLVQELDKLGVECVIFYSKKPKYKIEGSNIKSVVLPKSNKFTFEQFYLPRAFKDHDIDLYHATGNMGVPVATKVKAVLTVHDVIPLQIKNYFSYSKLPLLSKFVYLLRLKSSIKSADKIVCVSGYTKNELIRMGVSSSKIKVIYSGSNLTADPLKKSSEYGEYILNNGGMDIRKNTEGLIKAFKEIHKAFPNLKLLITGDNLRYKQKLEKLITQLDLRGLVVFTGYVSEGKLSTLVKNAKCICYPSIIEGFGFPVLEAFSLGTPVVTSNTSSLPEIAGDAAILVNPNNKREISQAVIKILSNAKLRKNLSELGLKQAKKFSWKKSANEYLNLYNSI